MRFLSVLSLLIVVVAALAGCSRYDMPSTAALSPGIQSSSYRAVDQLLKQSQPSGTVAVATINDINMMESSSPLGRIIADQVGARFAQLGHDVSEIRLRNDINVQQSMDTSWDGEYVLSRDRTQLAAKTNARTVVTGTYALGADSVLVNLRMIDVNTARVLAAHDYSLPMSDDVRRLTRNEQGGGMFSTGWAN